MRSSESRARRIAAYSVVVGGGGWAVLLYLTRWDTLRANLLPLLLFTAISLVVKRFGVHIARDVTHSLVGIVDLAAVLALGPIVGAWAAVLSGVTYLELRALRHRLFSWRFMGERPLFGSGLKAFLALGCGALYLRLGGIIPPRVVTWGMLLPLVTTLVVWFLADHLGWALRAWLRGGKEGLLDFLRRSIPYSVLVELVPLPFSIVIALAYVGMGMPVFLLLSLALIASGSLLQRLTDVGNRLKERVTELAALNEFGRRLVEAQLDVDQLCELLYSYSTQVVEAPTILLELVNTQQDLVNLVIHAEHGQRQPAHTVPMTGTMRWMSIQREPWICGNVAREGLPFEPLVAGDMPQSLMLVPLLAGSQLIGVLSMQSNETYAFEQAELDALVAMSSQTAMAISNAQLHIAQREEAWVSTALLQVAQAFVSSNDLHDNVERIARLAPLLVGVDRCMVFLWDKQTEEFVAYEAEGLSKKTAETFAALHLKPGELPLLDEAKQRQRYVAVENALESELVPAELRQAFGIQAVLAVPLMNKGALLGVLLVDYTQGPHRFSAHQISIIEGIAYQTAVAIENARLYESSLEQERTAEELRVAREIQISFLPERCPYHRGWEIAADWHAARGVGGDFYDFIPLSRDSMGLVIADVSDKGMAAAMFMSMSRTLVRAAAVEGRSPAKTLQRVNDLLMADTRSGMFVTLFYAILNWRSGRLTYASAGHNPPVLWRHATAEVTTLNAKGIALGVLEDITLEEREVIVEPGDILVLYTDGVTEPINVQEEEFGEERLVQVITHAHEQPCADLVRLIRTNVTGFVGGQPWFDDYTLVGVKRKESTVTSGK